jgi:hypothetical protein
MGPGVLGAVATGTDRVARWATIALGFSIPISVALDNFLLAVVQSRCDEHDRARQKASAGCRTCDRTRGGDRPGLNHHSDRSASMRATHSEASLPRFAGRAR